MKKTTHNIKDLVPTQGFIDTHDENILRNKIEGDDNFITTATHNGKTYMLNGHHSTMGRRFKREKTVDAYHVNLDNYNDDGSPR